MSADLSPDLEMRDLPPEDNPFLSSIKEPSTATGRKRGAPTKNSDVELIIRSLEKFYFSIGVMVRIIDVQDSVTICTQAEELAESWRVLLETDTKIRRMMKNMIKGGGWGTVITAHLLVALPIMEHHGLSFTKLMFGSPPEEEVEFDA